MKSNTSRVYYYTCYNTSSTILFPHLVNPVITLAVKICTIVADIASLLNCFGYLVKQRWVEHSQEGMELLLLVDNPANGTRISSVAKCWHGKWGPLLVPFL